MNPQKASVPFFDVQHQVLFIRNISLFDYPFYSAISDWPMGKWWRNTNPGR